MSGYESGRDHVHDSDPRVPAVPCWCGWQRPRTPDEDALDRIASLVAASEYHEDAVTLSEIAAIVRSTGRNAEAGA
jgi:hypothetical protein